jgi:DNA-binding Lrp family transcriptional regulator
MDKATLVANELEAEGLVIAALSRAHIPVTAVDWNWVPELHEWQLVVVSSLHDTKGPREAYARIIEALSRAGVYQSIPIRKLFVKSPDDPFAQELVRELKLTTEGTIHVIRNTPGVNSPRYSIVFAPYIGSGGAIPSVRLQDDEELRSFLGKRLGISPYEVNQALNQLIQKGSASIFNVQLNLRKAKKLNLAA